MRTLRHRGVALVHALALAVAGIALGGCPATGACTTCKYRTASFPVNASDLDGLKSVKMHTVIDNPSGDCPSTGCHTDRTDDITCHVSAPAGTKRQMLPVMSADGATHTVTIQITNASGTLPEVTAAVGTPTSTTGPSTPICP